MGGGEKKNTRKQIASLVILWSEFDEEIKKKIHA